MTELLGELRTKKYGILKLKNKLSLEFALTMINSLLQDLEDTADKVEK